jgi:CubicO group peptidase (beta-lactamase class C family)
MYTRGLEIPIAETADILRVNPPLDLPIGDEEDLAREAAYADIPSLEIEDPSTGTVGPPQLDIPHFISELDSGFSGSMGYAVQIRKDFETIHTHYRGMSRSRPDGFRRWARDTKMHVGSVSKFITAVAMVRMLSDHGLSLDDKIAPFLPSYWEVGNNIDEITFRQLLSHHSGFGVGGRQTFLF